MILRHAGRFFGLAALLLLTACAGGPPLTLNPTSFDRLPNWETDNHNEALATFVQSCSAMRFKVPMKLMQYAPSDVWRGICEKAAKVDTSQEGMAKLFFETEFQPNQAIGYGTKETGMITGYYVPVLNGSKKRQGKYQTPVYAPPTNLEDLKPYFTRAQIDAGALRGKHLELLYVDDPAELFFAQVQGSARVRLDTGELVQLQYAGQNGYDYTSIGKLLADRGVMERESITLFSLREWLRSNPGQGRDLMHENESYIFFRLKKADEMPKGAQGVPLTPERSIAVDKSIVPYGLPMYLATEVQGEAGLVPFHRLMISQDTGGAIKGPLRTDIFFGEGADAEVKAGNQKFPGKLYWLLPKETHVE